MSPYIIAGYVVALSTLSLYGVTLLIRVRAARRRLKVVEVDGRASGQSNGGKGAGADGT
jgi:hypothetical protein